VEGQIAFSRSEPFRRFVSGLPSLEGAERLIHGIYIEIRPEFRLLRDLDRLHAAGIAIDDFTPIDVLNILWGDASILGSVSGGYDEKDPPRDWPRFRGPKNACPYLVKIYVTPTRAATRLLRNQIEVYSSKQPFPALVIDEPMPTMCARVNASTDVSASTDGTLGGFLTDQKGIQYGVTCAHVAQTRGGAATFVDVNDVKITNAAETIWTNFPAFNDVGSRGHCTPRDPDDAATSTNGTVSEVDFALLEVKDAGISPANNVRGLGVVDQILDRNQLGSGSHVWLRGAITGPHEYEIMGFGVTQRVRYQGSGEDGADAYYCFSNVFDFCRPARRRLGRAFAPLPTLGDSGAWVLFNDQPNYSLYGMLFAVSGGRGLACFAQSMRRWAKSEWSLDLDI